MHRLLLALSLFSLLLDAASISLNYKEELAAKYDKQEETLKKAPAEIVRELEIVDALAYSFILNKAPNWLHTQLTYSAVFGTLGLLSFVANPSEENYNAFYLSSLALLPYVFTNPYLNAQLHMASAFKSPYQALRHIAAQERMFRYTLGGTIAFAGGATYFFPAILTPVAPGAKQEWVLSTALMVWGLSYLLFESEAERYLSYLQEIRLPSQKGAAATVQFTPAFSLRSLAPQQPEALVGLAMQIRY